MNFRTASDLAVEALQDYAKQALDRRGPVIRQIPMATLSQRLDLERLIANGGLRSGDVFREFLATYLQASTNLHHPGYMAHQVAVADPLSALASLIDGFTNNAMAIYEMGPAAATVECVVLNWMLGKIGWRPMPLPGAQTDGEDHGGGVLTHGGSLANLTALAAARARVAPDAWEKGTPANLVIVASPGCHYSIARAAGLLGLGQQAVTWAPADAEGRLDAGRLAACISELRSRGAEILAVVANACSTATGLYDPLRAIASVCRSLGVWLHIDGAHGASALVSAKHRNWLDGIDAADSVIWDGHKMLRAPTLCAAVLVRDHRDLDRAFREDASYLFHDKDEPGIDFIHRTVECTKAALGLKLFFALAADGESGIAAFFDRQTALAKEAADILRKEPGFEVAVDPQSNIVCFRVEGNDVRQLSLRKRLTEAGDFYVSTAEFGGRRWLRLALMNPATELNDIKSLVTEIRRFLNPDPLSR